MNAAQNLSDGHPSPATLQAAIESLRASLRAIHRELTMLENERVQLGALLTVAEHAVRTNRAADGGVQDAIADTVHLAGQRLDAWRDRLLAMKSHAAPGYAEGGAA